MGIRLGFGEPRPRSHKAPATSCNQPWFALANGFWYASWSGFRRFVHKNSRLCPSCGAMHAFIHVSHLSKCDDKCQWNAMTLTLSGEKSNCEGSMPMSSSNLVGGARVSGHLKLILVCPWPSKHCRTAGRSSFKVERHAALPWHADCLTLAEAPDDNTCCAYL